MTAAMQTNPMTLAQFLRRLARVRKMGAWRVDPYGRILARVRGGGLSGWCPLQMVTQRDDGYCGAAEALGLSRPQIGAIIAAADYHDRPTSRLRARMLTALRLREP